MPSSRACLEESRRAGKRQAAPFSKDKRNGTRRSPESRGKYGRQAVRAIPVPDKTFEAPTSCPCGGKVGAEGSIDLYQVDIPSEVRDCHRRLLISRRSHGAFRAQAARLRREKMGVSYDKIRLGFEQMLGFPEHCVVPCSVLPGVPSPPEMPWWRRCGPAPSSTPIETGWKQGGRVWLLREPARDRLRDPSGPWFVEQAASVLGKNYAGTLG